MVDQFADPSKDAPAATEGGGCLCGEIRYEFPRTLRFQRTIVIVWIVRNPRAAAKRPFCLFQQINCSLRVSQKRIPWWVRLAVT